MLKIRLVRIGKRNQPQFRIVVTNHRRPPKSNFIEVLGTYHPKAKSKIQSLKLERIKYWLKQGAHLSERMILLLKPYLKMEKGFVGQEIKDFEEKIKRKMAKKDKVKATSQKEEKTEEKKETKLQKEAVKTAVTQKEGVVENQKVATPQSKS